MGVVVVAVGVVAVAVAVGVVAVAVAVGVVAVGIVAAADRSYRRQAPLLGC